MLTAKFDPKSNQSRVVIKYQGRQITATGLNVIDIAGLVGVDNPINIEVARKQMDVESIVFGVIAQSHQEFVSRLEIDADVKSRFNGDDESERDTLIDNLTDYVNVDHDSKLHQALNQAVCKVLERLEHMELIDQCHPTNKGGQLCYNLTTVGRVLAELAFGDDPVVMLIANRYGADA